MAPKYLYTFDYNTKLTDNLHQHNFYTANSINSWNDGRIDRAIKISTKGLDIIKCDYDSYYHIDSILHFNDVGARVVNTYDWEVNELENAYWYGNIELGKISDNIDKDTYSKKEDLAHIMSLERELERAKQSYKEKWENDYVDKARFINLVNSMIRKKFIKYDTLLWDRVINYPFINTGNNDTKRIKYYEDHVSELDNLIESFANDYKYRYLERRCENNEKL